jgi:hypothetical protein
MYGGSLNAGRWSGSDSPLGSSRLRRRSRRQRLDVEAKDETPIRARRSGMEAVLERASSRAGGAGACPASSSQQRLLRFGYAQPRAELDRLLEAAGRTDDGAVTPLTRTRGRSRL